MPPAGFEPTISAGEWPQTYVLDRAATGTGNKFVIHTYIYIYVYIHRINLLIDGFYVCLT